MADDKTGADLEARLREAMRQGANRAPYSANVEQRVLSATYGRPVRKARPVWFLPVVNGAVIALVIAAVVGGVLLVRGGPAKHSSTPPAVPVTTSPAPSDTRSAPTSAAPSASTSSSPSAPVGPAGGAVPAGFVPYSATWISASTGWVLGTAPCQKAPCTSIVRTRDGGSTWVGIPAPVAGLQINANTPASVSSIRFADARDGWAFGSALYSTHDGGASWTKQALGSDGTGPRVVALESDGAQAWAAVDSCSIAASCTHMISVYVTAVGADSWRMIGSPLPDGNAAGSSTPVHLVVGSNNWWLTASSVWHGSGANAPVVLTGPCATNFALVGFAAADPQHLDALCAGQGAAGSSQQQLEGTTDGGRTWKPSGPAFLGPDNVAGIADNAAGTLLLAASSGGSTVARTTNDGQRFGVVLTDPAGGGTPWSDLGFTTQQQAMVILTGRALYVSRDAGATWTAVRF